jgi:hypothetical protein
MNEMSAAFLDEKQIRLRSREETSYRRRHELEERLLKQ